MKFVYELQRSTLENGCICGGNEMINMNDRIHPHIRAGLTAHLRNISMETAIKTYGHREQSLFSDMHPCHIGIIIHPPTKRKMDAMNWYPTVKALIDGLTDAGIFEDDNDSVITSTTFLSGPVNSNKKYRIEIDIREGINRLWAI